jgi:protein-tyrosine phosphatase
MAGALFKKSMPGILVDTAGLSALVGRGPDPKAIAIMQREGLDISAERAKKISNTLLSNVDLVLVMDEEQKRHLSANYPQISGKVMRLGRWTNFDIPDPFGQCDAVFEDSYVRIASAVDSWKTKIA